MKVNTIKSHEVFKGVPSGIRTDCMAPGFEVWLNQSSTRLVRLAHTGSGFILRVDGFRSQSVVVGFLDGAPPKKVAHCTYVPEVDMFDYKVVGQ